MTPKPVSQPNPTPSGWVLAQHGGAVEPITQYVYSADYWVERTRPWERRDYEMGKASMDISLRREKPC